MKHARAPSCELWRSLAKSGALWQTHTDIHQSSGEGPPTFTRVPFFAFWVWVAFTEERAQSKIVQIFVSDADSGCFGGQICRNISPGLRLKLEIAFADLESGPHNRLGVAQTVFLVNRVSVPLPTRGRFDENGANDEFAF